MMDDKQKFGIESSIFIPNKIIKILKCMKNSLKNSKNTVEIQQTS